MWSTSPDSPPSIRPIKPRVKRVRTGCRDCRRRRVKCPEGEIDHDGRKMPCGRCAEAGVDCFYPRAGDVSTMGEWEPAAGVPHDIIIVDECKRPAPRRRQVGMRLDLSKLEGDTPGQAVMLKGGSAKPEWLEPMPPIDLDSLPASLLDIPAIRALLEPYPTAPVFTPSLSGLSCTPIEHNVAAYFETRGCTEIVAAPSNRINWIYTLLFPRLLDLLSCTEVGTPRAAIKTYAHHSFLRLSYVHRANVERDATRRAEYRLSAARQKRLADYDLIQAQVRYEQSSWKTEEYLMAFFVACMADMLDSQTFSIDYATAFDLQRTSEFSGSLRDMLGVYSTLMAACTPHDPICSLRFVPGFNAAFELAPNGNEWVERFFGVSRPLLVLVGAVNRLVLDRRNCLRQPGDVTSLAAITAEAQQLDMQLSADRLWSEERQAFGKSARIQRGTEVTRLALQVMVWCELLGARVGDPRVESASRAVVELINDTEPDEAAGYTWAGSITAIYTADLKLREDIRKALRMAQSWSFGTGYQGADDIMDMCWKVHREQGEYAYGVAPWREALAACGRSMYV